MMHRDVVPRSRRWDKDGKRDALWLCSPGGCKEQRPSRQHLLAEFEFSWWDRTGPSAVFSLLQKRIEGQTGLGVGAESCSIRCFYLQKASLPSLLVTSAAPRHVL